MRTIGYVLGSFPVLSETFVGDDMRAVMARGHRLAFVVMRRRTEAAQPDDMRLAEQAIDLRGLDAWEALSAAAHPSASAVEALLFCRRQTRLPVRSLIWNGLKIAAAFRRAGVEHIHAHFSGGTAAHAIFAARWMGVSVSFICHGHDVYAEPEDLALKLRSADGVVAVCDDMASDLRAIEPQARVQRIACGVDPSAFVPVQDGTENDRFLFVGRLVPCKGVDDALIAVAASPSDVRLDIVGDGPQRAALEQQAQALGLGERVRFLGARDRSWLAREAAHYRGLVAPFKPDVDGTRDTGPLVVKEAMAMALPVLTTRQMGLKETVAPETGVLVEPGDAGALGVALSALVRMTPEERRAMGLRGRERVMRHFTLERQGALLSGLFEAA